jgi:hypothetical protein
MVLIEYYTVSDAYDESFDAECLNLKYSDKNKLIDLVVKNYKPSFDLRDVHTNLRLYGEYQNYGTFYDFSNCKNGSYSGYYSILTGETQHKIEGNVIKFFAELSIQFTRAERIHIPEIKMVGHPYRPASTEINTIIQDSPIPLYMCKKYGDDYIYGIESNMDNWYKTHRAIVTKSLYINHDKIHIY